MFLKTPITHSKNWLRFKVDLEILTYNKKNYYYYYYYYGLGMGSNNVIGVKVDPRGKMSMTELRKEIVQCLSKGQEPFLVAATAGKSLYLEKNM